MLLNRLGIHPVAALGVVAADWMLFGTTLGTMGIGWLLSLPAGFLLGIAVALMQRYGSPRDGVALAAAKGILIGFLTAIPTALPSVVTGGAGTLGAIALLRERRKLRSGPRVAEPGVNAGRGGPSAPGGRRTARLP